MGERAYVRQTIRYPSQQRLRRLVDERLAVRFPSVSRRIFALGLSLPLRSRLRRTLVARLTVQAFQAVNRQDYELAAVLYADDVEFEFGAGAAPPDIAERLSGRYGLAEIWRQTLEAFPNARLVPREVLDAGDRILMVEEYDVHGRGSDVPLTGERFELLHFGRGMIVRQRMFGDREAAMGAFRE